LSLSRNADALVGREPVGMCSQKRGMVIPLGERKEKDRGVLLGMSGDKNASGTGGRGGKKSMARLFPPRGGRVVYRPLKLVRFCFLVEKPPACWGRESKGLAPVLFSMTEKKRTFGTCERGGLPLAREEDPL